MMRATAIKSTSTIPRSIKMNIALLMLLGIPGIFSGGFFVLIGGLSIIGGSYIEGVFLLIIGGVPVGLGVASIVIGNGLWKLNYTAWKGAITLLVLYTLTTFVPMINQVYLLPLQTGQLAIIIAGSVVTEKLAFDIKRGSAQCISCGWNKNFYRK